MTPTDAAQLLELSADAAPEQIEARFLELRAKLENKIAKAPTPGLKAKYRDSLEQITEAFETLTLATDGSSLPVVQKSKVEGPGSKVESPVSPREFGASTVDARPSTPPRAKTGGGREFAIVALIAVLVLAAGGWFIMKTRAENAEKALIAAEAQAEADRVAEVARQEAEAEKARLAEERRLADIEKQRLADEAAAETERLNALSASLRAELAELNLTWELVEREERDAERALSDLRSEARAQRDPAPEVANELNARLDALENFYDWLRDFVARHPARLLLVRATELVSARAFDDAVPQVQALRRELQNIEADIKREEDRRLTITGTLEITSVPSGLTWEAIDGFGRSFRGKTPAHLRQVGRGLTQVKIERPGWPVQTKSIQVGAGATVKTQADFLGGSLQITAQPATTEIWLRDRQLGTGSAGLRDVIPGAYPLRFVAEGFIPQETDATVLVGQTAALAVELKKRPDFVIPGLNISMRWIPAGTFLMGSERGEPDERPVTQVTLSQPFWTATTELTNGQWKQFLATLPRKQRKEWDTWFKYRPDSGSDQLPLNFVWYHIAVDFLSWLNDRERQAGRLPAGYVYSLPTEAQWEYAARAGSTADFYGPLNDIAWHAGNSSDHSPHAVAQKLPNAWGLYDVQGNVWELTRNFTPSVNEYFRYPGGTVQDYSGLTKGTRVVRRGGSFFKYTGTMNPSGLNICRVSNRGSALLDQTIGDDGIRVFLVPAY